MGGERHGRSLVVVAAVAAALLVAGCTTSTSEEEGASGASSSTIAVTEAELARSPERERPRRTAETKDYDEVLAATLSDLQAYWADELPAVYGLPYTPVPAERLIPASPATDVPSCGGFPYTYEEDVADNAFWCYTDDFMAWDDVGLMPGLFERYGPFSVSFVLAHEWGHVVQDQAGTIEIAPSVITELQADCFAGSWMGRLAAGASPDLTLDATAFEQALAGLVFFRDAPGSSPDDPQAHGSGFDRVSAFQEGYELGATRCADYLVDPPLVVQLPFTDLAEARSGGNLQPADLIELAYEDLNAYWVGLLPAFRPVEGFVAFDLDDPPSCGGDRLAADEVEFTMFFCEEDNTVYVDTDLVRTVQQEIGDFGIATLMALQWGVSAQLQDGQTDVALAQGLQQSCFAGSWSGRVLDGDAEGLSLSPGDLDEAIQAFLAFSEAPDDEGETRLGTAFERVQAFRTGFLEGEAACAAYTEGR